MISKPIAIKSTIGLLGLGGASFVAYEGYKALTKEKEKATIRQSITNANRTILGTGDNGWDIKFHAYRTLTPKIELTNNSAEGLKTWCGQVLDKPSNTQDGKVQAQAIKVCTLPTSREKLLKESKTLATENDWQGRVDAYPGEGKAALAIPEFKDKAKPTKQDIENWCSKALDEEIKDGKGNYELTLKWCTKTGT